MIRYTLRLNTIVLVHNWNIRRKKIKNYLKSVMPENVKKIFTAKDIAKISAFTVHFSENGLV